MHGPEGMRTREVTLWDQLHVTPKDLSPTTSAEADPAEAQIARDLVDAAGVAIVTGGQLAQRVGELEQLAQQQRQQLAGTDGGSQP